MNFVEIDNCPVPAGLGRRIRKLKEKVPGAWLNSCYRGSHPEGVAILRRNGKRSQAELYKCWQDRVPGCNPANPPGRSTHECRSDGAAFAGPVGRRLPGWACGMDWSTSTVDDLIHAGNSFAWRLWRPYASGSEAHHLNFKMKPPWRWGRKRHAPEHPTLKMGAHRRRAVKRLQVSLRRHGFEDIAVDGHFGRMTERAVAKFQRRNDLLPDGIVGPRTWRALLKGGGN